MKQAERRSNMSRLAQLVAWWCIALLCAHCTPPDTAGTVVLLWPDQLAGASVTIEWSSAERFRTVVAFPARITVPFDQPIHVRATKKGFETFTRDFMLLRSAPREEIVIEMREASEPDGYGLRSSDVPPVVLTRSGASPGAMGSKWFEAQYWGGFSHGPVLSIVGDARGDVWHVRLPSGQPTWVGRIDPGLASKMLKLQSPALAAPFEEHAFEGSSDKGGSSVSVYGSSFDERGTVLASEGPSTRGRRASPAAHELLGWILAVRREARRVVNAQE